jgi:hypothetical protein
MNFGVFTFVLVLGAILPSPKAVYNMTMLRHKIVGRYEMDCG